MTPAEENILKREIKQVRGFLSALRTENITINQELAGMVTRIAKMRTAQLGIEVLITEFEANLGKAKHFKVPLV